MSAAVDLEQCPVCGKDVAPDDLVQCEVAADYSACRGCHSQDCESTACDA